MEGWPISRFRHSLVYSMYLGDAKSCDVLAVGGGAVPSSPQGRQDAADALHGYTSVYGVVWWRGGTRQASAGVVITDGFHGGR